MDVYGRRRLVDGATRWPITLGGVTIIVGILAMLVFLVGEVLPLWKPPSVEEASPLAAPPGVEPIVVLATNDYRELAFTLTAGGLARVVDLRDDIERFADTLDVFDGRRITSAAPVSPNGRLWLAGTDDGLVVPVELEENVAFGGDRRTYTPAVRAGAPVAVAEGDTIDLVAGVAGDAGFLGAARTRDGAVVMVRRTVRRSPLGGERASDAVTPIALDPLHDVSALVFGGGNRLYLGTRAGALLEVAVENPAAAPLVHTVFRADAITALGALLGRQSLVVGGSAGQVEVWFRALTPDPEGGERLGLVPAHTFEPFPAEVAGFSPSARDKRFLAWDAQGNVRLLYSTTEETLLRAQLEASPPQVVQLAPRGDGVLATAPGGLIQRFAVEVPHPEVTMRSLFGKVHYEGYAEPAFVWQSTGATDETEPKLSLVPLVFGTLKGTFYALVVSVPIGILAALYSALFMRPEIRNVVKPAMELMAALPSVVLGLLAALWLAPRLQAAMPAALLVPVAAVAVIVAGGALWRVMPRRFTSAAPPGTEAFLLIPLLAAGVVVLMLQNGWMNELFDGNFSSWLYDELDVRYDQRNAIVVGLAMGLAVIPIIFSISEDAIASVPRHLTAGSLALGATPWQTAWRVVLPAASPGIFSAVMIGFGRAVGETMIVLMATGNTPIMDWSFFNGFRTLSANIAVEIPEAPHGDSLYRVLFLAALLLFVLTFIVNTAAEVVRHRLRQRYGRF